MSPLLELRRHRVLSGDPADDFRLHLVFLRSTGTHKWNVSPPITKSPQTRVHTSTLAIEPPPLPFPCLRVAHLPATSVSWIRVESHPPLTVAFMISQTQQELETRSPPPDRRRLLRQQHARRSRGEDDLASSLSARAIGPVRSVSLYRPLNQVETHRVRSFRSSDGGDSAHMRSFSSEASNSSWKVSWNLARLQGAAGCATLHLIRAIRRGGRSADRDTRTLK